jgi:hypothetical protein
MNSVPKILHAALPSFERFYPYFFHFKSEVFDLSDCLELFLSVVPPLSVCESSARESFAWWLVCSASDGKAEASRLARAAFASLSSLPASRRV